MMDIWEDKLTDILVEKEKTHGAFRQTAWVAQRLKDITRDGTNWGLDDSETLSLEQREALDGICVKMARIVCGNPKEADHWLDIAGYAALGRRSSGDVH
jgi:hypothetical protein